MDTLKALLAKVWKDEAVDLEPGRHYFDDVVTVRISGSVEKQSDQMVAPTVSIPLILTLALFLGEMWRHEGPSLHHPAGSDLRSHDDRQVEGRADRGSDERCRKGGRGGEERLDRCASEAEAKRQGRHERPQRRSHAGQRRHPHTGSVAANEGGGDQGQGRPRSPLFCFLKTDTNHRGSPIHRKEHHVQNHCHRKGNNEVERNAARDANEIQDACNLVAIVGCWHRHLLAMSRAASAATG